jgi:hypothetical protein
VTAVDIAFSNKSSCRCQRPRGLRRRFAAARLLKLWVRISPGSWMSVCCECCVLSGRGLCDELITRPEESCRVWGVVVCDLETSWMRRPWSTGAKRKKIKPGTYIVAKCVITMTSCDTKCASLLHVWFKLLIIFLYNKTNQMYQFPKFTPAWNSTCFGQFICPSSGVYSLYTQQWYMSYRVEDSFRAGPGWNCSSILFLLESCVTYAIAECAVDKLLMMDRRNVRNM